MSTRSVSGEGQRPFLNKSIDELEALFSAGHADLPSLLHLSAELTFRRRPRAQRLAQQVGNALAALQHDSTSVSECTLVEPCLGFDGSDATAIKTTRNQPAGSQQSSRPDQMKPLDVTQFTSRAARIIPIQSSSERASGPMDGTVIDLEAKLQLQVENWRRRLLDIGNRNPLINCTFGTAYGALEISHPDAETIWLTLAAESEAGSESMRFPWRRDLVPPPLETPPPPAEAASDEPPPPPKDWNPPLSECLASSKLTDDDLLTGLGDKALDRRLRTLDGHAKLSLSEQGVHCLYVAFGFLKWFESLDSEQELWSPLMLVPVALSRASADAPWELSEAEDDAVDNLCLRQRLKQDFNLELPALPDINDLEESGARQAYLDAVRHAIKANERWSVEDRCALGRFAFPKVAMWRDLGDHSKLVHGHPLCRSIGGDSSLAPQNVFGAAEELPSARQLDEQVPPGTVKMILDCDSSQLEAIVAARRGISFVLDGPPGTGKSQTIANIIADALSEGRRVLFVSEKVSALEVVKRRLDDRGLGDFCLECHSSKANRKLVLDELKWCLELPAEVYDDATPRLDQLKRRRDALNNYVRALHTPRPPLDLSPYEVHGYVSRLARLGMATRSRCTLPDVRSLDRARFECWLAVLGRATDVAGVIRAYETHLWRGCSLTHRSLSLDEDLQHHFGVLANAFQGIAAVTAELVSSGLLGEVTPASLNQVTKSLKDCAAVPEVPASWFRDPARVSGAILEKAGAQNELFDVHQRLGNYQAGVIERFPFDSVQRLHEKSASDWLQQAAAVLPMTVRSQTQSVAMAAECLSHVERQARALNAALNGAVTNLQLPAVAAIRVRSVPKLIQMFRAILDAGMMRPAWFDSTCWTRLRQRCEAALQNLRACEAVVLRAPAGIRADQLLQFNHVIPQPDVVTAAWERIRAFCGNGDTQALEGFLKTVISIQQTTRDVRDAARAIGADLGVASLPVPPGPSDEFVASLRNLADVSAVHGSWRDSAVRQRIHEACATALSDLDEAAAIRRDLETRVSHRAFQRSSASLVAQSEPFESLLRRWFGGFGRFRREVADLYSGQVPATPSLLTDCRRLRTYHRRTGTPRELADELRTVLPAGFVGEDRESWTRLQTAVQRLSELLNVIPGLTSELPASDVKIDSARLIGNAEALGAKLTELDRQVSTAGLNQQLSRSRWTDLENLAAVWVADATLCLQSVQAGTACGSATRLPEILVAARVAHEYAALTRHNDALFQEEPELMPDGARALHAADWQRTLAGIAAAEYIAQLVRSPEKLRDQLCTPGRIDRAELEELVANAEAQSEQMTARLHELAETTLPSFGIDETERMSLEDLATACQSCSAQLFDRHSHLAAVQEVLREGVDIPVSELAAHLMWVAQGRRAIDRALRADSVLQELDIDVPAGVELEDRDRAEWLHSQSRVGISPLVQAVASDPQHRIQVKAAADHIRAVCEAEFKTAWEFLKSCFDMSVPTAAGNCLRELPVGKLAAHLQQVRSSTAGLDDWLQFSRWCRDLSECGLSGVLDELLAHRYEPHEARDVVLSRCYRGLCDAIAADDPHLGEFDLAAHERLREQFQQLDRWEVKAASTRIRQYQLGRDDRPRPGWSMPATSELGILQREIQKKRRHKPLRKLFAEIPTVLQRLKPCIMMSPLSVSTFLDSEEIRFDLVIFDEASQVFPWDAIGAIYRGTQLIVAGDEKQLPPTNFFNRADVESEDEEEDIGDYESILSLCKSINMPAKQLKWHYRSRREPLIAFSNRHFYNDNLVTFPSVRDASGDSVRLEHVPSGRWVGGKNIIEAERVADLVVQHHRSRPEVSLGVIAFNAAQQHAIEDAIYERRRSDPEVDALFDMGLTEPMFIKNLESVQGDERDVVLLSMGYGFNDAGKFLKNFGPLSKSGGERRLNVAVTRARHEVVLVASVRAANMDLSGSLSAGAHLLKGYLEYAERGVGSLARIAELGQGEYESGFEEEVAEALVRRGLSPVAQVGCGGFRIDLALKHPERPGEFCLGIECDGATYHSSPTARDRDRIRQSVLEGLGWNIIRIWSTDWIRTPERQIDRILSAYECAIESADGGLSSAETAEEVDDADGLEPRYVQANAPKWTTYKSIADVPDSAIQAAATNVLVQAGATDWDDLIKLMARELGFKRVGSEIRHRIESILEQELRHGKLRRVGDRIGTADVEGRSAR